MTTRGKRIPVGRTCKSGRISIFKRYRVKIDGRWYEGRFSKQSFGWQFDDYGPSGMQLNLLDEVYELPPAAPMPRRKAGGTA